MGHYSMNDYNKGGFIAFMFCMVTSFALFIYVSFIYEGIDLKEIPEVEVSGPEQAIGAVDKAASFDINAVEKPWESSEAFVAYGHKVYKTNCSSCHGNDGAGDGPVAASLQPAPRNFVEGNWTAGGDSKSLYLSIQKGLPGTSMAPFGHLSKNDRWAMVHYIRSVTKNKIKDDPAKLEAFAAKAE